MKIKAIKKISQHKLFLVVILFFTFILLNCVTTYASSKLYFDEDGNLVFTAVSGKDYTGVKYRTIGWVLKRYDLPMDANGQQYVIIPKRTGGTAYPDPLNPDVLICNFKSDRNEILNAIGSVSKEWQSQLIMYGGDIYIDSVMTVVMYGVEMGRVSDTGSLSGEVYCTYEGISKARPWGYPPELMQYYDIVVEYPAQLEIPKQSVTTSKNTLTYESPIINNLTLGSNERGNELYDITKAIPSGEKLYAYGSISNYCYGLKLSLVRGTISIPVEVSTTYILKWKGYNGENKEEVREISRYYLVDRDFSYYEINSAQVYGINELSILNGAINGGKYTKAYLSKPTLTKISYGDVMSHISINADSLTIHTGTKTISVNGYLKPDIPNEDYSRLAENRIKGINVKSDRVVIGNNTVLSDAVVLNKGKSPIYFSTPLSNIYITGIGLRENARNETYSSVCELKYKNISGNNTRNNSTYVEKINVHTPIVSYASIKEDKALNQEVSPRENTIVAGCEFEIETGTKGFHSDNLGYGDKNYEKYLAKSEVRFPFEVVKNEQIIEANRWIEFKEGDRLSVPYSVNIGDYEVELRNYAINSVDSDNIGGSGANTDKNEYFAYSKFNVHITGRLFEFTVQEDNRVEDLIVEIGNANTALDFSMVAVGDYNPEDFVRVNYNYFYYDKEERIPVNVFVINGRSGISAGKLEKANEYEDIYFDTGEVLEENITNLSGRLQLGEEIYIFPKDIEIGSIKDIVKNYKNRLTDGYLIINFDSYIYRENTPFISYINEENSKLGYCNMWKRENFRYTQNINENDVVLKSGDTALLFGRVKDFYDFKVVGTN